MPSTWSIRMTHRALLLKTLLAAALTVGALVGTSRAQEAAAPVNIGSRRELFADRFLVDRLEGGARLALHRPREEAVALQFDRPWEGRFCGYCTVIKDGDKYRLYYRGRPVAGKDGDENEVTCYAESTDGVRFSRPTLRLHEVHGTRENNVILANAAPVTHNFSPFLDSRPGVPAAERFKALGGTSPRGLVAYVSADGILWKKLREEPVITEGAFDSQNVAFWSEAEGQYVCYLRTFKRIGNTGYRWISRTTSKDFRTWTKPVEMSFGDAPPEHLYTNQTHPYFRAPHLYISTAARFFPGRQVITAEQAREINVDPGYFRDTSDAVLLTTRGGDRYDRTFLEGFIRPDIGLSNWVSRTNYPALNVVQTGPTEMSLYVQQNYGQPTAHLRRYSLRLDGFASVQAPYGGGELVTRPLTFSGKRLTVNFATSAAGGIRVEIQTPDGKPVPGHTLADATELIGNEISREVTWKGGADVSALAGKPVRLRFVMKDADLYSLQFQ
jgi:hypothetical protein